MSEKEENKGARRVVVAIFDDGRIEAFSQIRVLHEHYADQSWIRSKQTIYRALMPSSDKDSLKLGPCLIKRCEVIRGTK